MMTPEKLTNDLFYVDLNNDRIEWVSYEPESNAEGMFVKIEFNRDMLMRAVEGVEDNIEVFDFLEEECKTEFIERGTEKFRDEWVRVATNEPFVCGCNDDTVQNLIDVFSAKEYIDEYCRREFRQGADYDNLSAIPIGYTTITDAEHELQAYANLNDLRIEVYVDERLAKYYQYDTLWEMVNIGMPDLEFDDLIDIPDWIISRFEREGKIDDLAVRMCFFMKENDPYSYTDIMEVGETDSDMVRRIKADLHDMRLVPGTLSDMQDLIHGRSLSKEEENTCYELMTDLYHLYTDAMFEPVEQREAEILYDTLYALNLQEYKVGFDDPGINVSYGKHKWNNSDIYRHFAEVLPADKWREFRDVDFRTYTDFKDLAAKKGVQICVPNKSDHERRVSR